ncbi:Cys-tRNA(Pro) deacylase [Amygdalobacter nucleatus]|uniref:Cys-tRNA(Pro)/Cys-tRNA(Cys) deacylase n=1 Tax=Amygdalobacter nucleatus TaxID=3029274 RepID=A0A133YGU3_9FIRM|nr:Cys-tRNA(Pro) deacylase [Amygdalobacter nucleatus]KXB42406.1 YbaK/EbsC protein [Amygdalobacter nucleatus]MDF0485981.1 Cys-tRNA(Pro) deacylase [Amygdalobacter nucleatus]
MKKTNAMRKLDQAKLTYEVLTYEVDENDLSGVHVAISVGEPVEHVFKTLVLKDGNQHFVAVLPVAANLDMKKVARVFDVKSVSMLNLADLLPLTGYVRGGCSPVGMKKQFKTVFAKEAEDLDFILVSGGQRGLQLKLNPKDLIKYLGAETADIVLG